jgi:uncharacterized protein
MGRMSWLYCGGPQGRGRSSSHFILAAGLICLSFVHSPDVAAQAVGNERVEQREAANDSAVMIVADHPDTTMMKIADDLSVAMRDDRSRFRVVAVAGDGAEGNVRDLILLRNMDVGITDLTALERMKRSKDLSQNLALEVSHVATLFPDKLQILARTTIASVKDLTGKRVAVGLRDSGTANHAAEIFKSLGVRVVSANLAPADAAEALTKGEIDAFVCFCLTSPGIYQRLMFNPDLHILPIPFEGPLQRDYLPAALSHEEFPSFIRKGESIETIAVTLVLVTYNWPKGNPRYARVEDFVNRFFAAYPKLQEAPRHRGWRSVQMSATATGWPRFAAAAEWRPAKRPEAVEDMRIAFSEFLSRYTSETATVQPQQQELFEEFLNWRRSAR